MPTRIEDHDGVWWVNREPWDGELDCLREFVEEEGRRLEGAEALLRRRVFHLRYRQGVSGEYECVRERVNPEAKDGIEALLMRTVGLKANGASWAEIGDVFGCTGEAVRKRFGHWAEAMAGEWLDARDRARYEGYEQDEAELHGEGGVA